MIHHYPSAQDGLTESVYTIDGVEARLINIEDEEGFYIMHPNGNIYDQAGKYVGQTNAAELDESEGHSSTEQILEPLSQQNFM